VLNPVFLERNTGCNAGYQSWVSLEKIFCVYILCCLSLKWSLIIIFLQATKKELWNVEINCAQDKLTFDFGQKWDFCLQNSVGHFHICKHFIRVLHFSKSMTSCFTIVELKSYTLIILAGNIHSNKVTLQYFTKVWNNYFRVRTDLTVKISITFPKLFHSPSTGISKTISLFMLPKKKK